MSMVKAGYNVRTRAAIGARLREDGWKARRLQRWRAMPSQPARLSPLRILRDSWRQQSARPRSAPA
jgi:hypothetical protein